MPVNGKHFLNAFTIQIRLVSNQKLTRIQRRANRRLQSKVFGFWEKYENGKKIAAQLLKSMSRLNVLNFILIN